MSGSHELKETTAGYASADQRTSEFERVVDQLYREEVIDARNMSHEEKFLAGEELFEFACTVTLAGIRNQAPNASKEECQRILNERVALGERLDWVS